LCDGRRARNLIVEIGNFMVMLVNLRLDSVRILLARVNLKL
jgi:hypothetical protein